jgi:beta-RFAP synthase
MSNMVHVRAPCRLHFGMFSFGHTDRPQFGGVGMMIDPPAVDVTISQAPFFTARGDLTQRVVEFAEKLVRKWTLGSLPACEISVTAPRDHTGLGVGTQLGLSVAAGLRRFLDLPPLEFWQLAIMVDRATRSAIGSLGFEHGGMILDAGKEPGERFGAFMWEAIPTDWRIVLTCSREQRGLTGKAESDAFVRLPPVSDEVADELRRIAFQEMTSAAAWADCAAFGEALYRYGRMAGECFAAVQGGPFASSEIAQRVEVIRQWGIPGVGQSSWGPTVFAIVASDDEANALVERLQSESAATGCEITIARPNNSGAQIEVSHG